MARLVAINISSGGIPKLPVSVAEITPNGLNGDGRGHSKHDKPDRALSLMDLEIISDLRQEGYHVGPGVMGENLTLEGLGVQSLPPGTRLRFSGGVEIELTEPRRPCYLLDTIHPELKDAVVGRIGYMARVVRLGRISNGESIEIVSNP